MNDFESYKDKFRIGTLLTTKDQTRLLMIIDKDQIYNLTTDFRFSVCPYNINHEITTGYWIVWSY